MPAPIMPNLSERDLRRRHNALHIGGTRVVLPAAGDYVILWEAAGKSRKHLAQVDEVRGDSLRVTHEVGRGDSHTTVETEYPLFHLVANLGPSPAPGSAYGVKIMPWRGNRAARSGAVSFWTELARRERKIIGSSLKRTHAVLTETGLGAVYPLDWRVEANSGKWAGWYKASGGRMRDGVMTRDTICLKPAEWNRRDTDFIVFHELGHAVQMRLLHPAEFARWIRVYHDYLEVQGVDEATLNTVQSGLLGAGADYHPPEDSPEGKVYAAVLEYLERVHRLKRRSVFALLQGGGGSKLAEMWPDAAELSEFHNMPTDYSEEAPEELWCECFALHLTGRLADERLSHLMTRTLQRIRGRSSNIGG